MRVSNPVADTMTDEELETNYWPTDARKGARVIRHLYDELDATPDGNALARYTLGGEIAWQWSCLDAALNDARARRDPRWRDLSHARQALLVFERRRELQAAG